MEFEYKGGNCVVINSKQGTVVIDGKLSEFGLNDIQPKDAIELATQAGFAGADGRVTIDSPGEYEVSDLSILGIPAKRLIDYDESEQSTIFRLVFPGVRVAVLGHVVTPLSDEQLEQIGVIDVLVVPVGGGGYTLDAHAAAQVVNALDPKAVIPTHYADSKTKFEVPQDELDLFIKELGSAHESMPKWKLKGGSGLPESLTIIELTRTS